MEQLLTCPISLENPTCQNLWCKSKYQLEKMGYGMSLVTLQPQFKIFINAMEQLLTCPISLENPICQNLWCKSKYQLEKMGNGMSLVTLQPQFKFFIKITKKSLQKYGKVRQL